MSQEYITALAIVLVGIFQIFKVDTNVEQVASIITTLAGIYVMIRRYKRGDITVAGVRK